MAVFDPMPWEKTDFPASLVLETFSARISKNSRAAVDKTRFTEGKLTFPLDPLANLRIRRRSWLAGLLTVPRGLRSERLQDC